MSRVVLCQNVWKCYRYSGGIGIKEFLVGKNRHVGRFAREWALCDINLDVMGGQAFGIVGPNASGKSTLLSLLLGVLRPDQGDIQVLGRVASLLELGAGFHPDLTGRENIFLYGSILGITLQEIEDRFEAIVKFSGLEGAIELPLRTYSAGMITRLGFSTVIHSPVDLLLIDEVLAVGDAEFQKKCRDFLTNFKNAGGTLVIVSHDLETIVSLCDVGICLNEGRIVSQGDITQVVGFYKEFIRKQLEGEGARAKLAVHGGIPQ